MTAESMEDKNETFSPCSNAPDTESILLSGQNTDISVHHKNPCANYDNDDYNDDQLTPIINGRDLDDYTAMNLCWTMVYIDIVDKASTDTIQKLLNAGPVDFINTHNNQDCNAIHTTYCIQMATDTIQNLLERSTGKVI